MKKYIVGGIVGVILFPVSTLAYGGGVVPLSYAASYGKPVQSFDYTKALQRQILELRLKVARLQLQLLKIHYPHLFAPKG